MHKIYKFLALSFLVFLFSFVHFPFSAYSQTSLNACLQNARCAADIGATKAALSVPGAATPFVKAGAAVTTRSGLPVVLGGAALALSYLNPLDMQNLRDRAFSDYPSSSIPAGKVVFKYQPAQGFNESRIPIFGCGSSTCNLSVGASWGIYYAMHNGEKIIDNVQDPDALALGVLDSPYTSPAPSLSNAVGNLSDSAILAAGATAAAAAAAAAANSGDLDDALAAAAAAIAAAGLVPVGSADKAAADAAAAAAAAVASSAAAAAAAQKQQIADKALADRLSRPSALPRKDFANSVNFVTFTLAAFSNKFPLDIVYGSTDASSPACPSFTLFFYKWQLCFLMPLFTVTRWIVFISLSTKVILEF